MQTTTTILPIYLQKYIIRIICEHIDGVNRKITIPQTHEIRLQKLKDENQIRKDIVSFSLVDKCWFNTFSQFLTVSVDFITYKYNFKDDNEKLIQPTYTMDTLRSHFIVKRLNNQITTTSNGRLLKDENIKELVLNIQYWTRDPISYDITQLDQIELPQIQFIFKLLNQTIKSRFINLEKLIIITNPTWFIYFRFIEFNNIKVNHYSTGLNVNSIPTNIKEIENLEVTDKDLECFKLFKPLNYVGSLHSTNFLNFKYLYDNGVGCFQKTNWVYMESFNENITIQNLTYQIKLLPNVSEYHIEICIYKLIYQLNGDGGGDDDNDTIDINKEYQCFGDQNSNINFKEYWNQFSESIINHKHLKKFTISHHCNHLPTLDNDFEIEFHDASLFNTDKSTKLIDQLKFILSNNKSINEFYLEEPNYSTTNNVLNNFKK